VDNNLAEALETKDAATILEIYIKVFRAKAKMADDNYSTTHDFQHLVSLIRILKHFLNLNDCFEDRKVSYDFDQKELFFLSDEEDRLAADGADGEPDDESDDEADDSDEEADDSDNEDDDSDNEDDESDDYSDDDNA